jgi:Mrp family chromosome partitioning ATPase
MLSEEQVRESLRAVLVPGMGRSLVQLNLVREITVADESLSITLASAALGSEAQDWLKTEVNDVTKKLPGIKKVEIGFVEARPKELNQIRQVVAVVSGKGGVGKSLVASLAALALARSGQEVGILDADITGPSIPMMFGISERPAGNEIGILPVPSRSGIEIMSINLLLPHEDDAVVWRGPLIAKAIQQFWEEVLWGRLDCLMVDLPPGTADAPLTVMQSLPLTGVLITFTPQDLTTMVVRKAVKMAQMMHIPILGVVENMSYFLVPGMEKRIEIFGKSKGEEMAKATGVPLLGQFPLDPELARLCDEGDIERYDSDAFAAFAQALSRALSQAEGGPG